MFYFRYVHLSFLLYLLKVADEGHHLDGLAEIRCDGPWPFWRYFG